MRNENGFGSIVCLDKSGKKRRKPWVVRITTGWIGGKQQRKYLGYYKTQADALIALADYHKHGVNIDLSKATLGEVYDRWYSRIEPNSSKSVLIAHNMAKTRFGKLEKVPIVNIKADHLQDWMDNIELSPGTKRRLKSTMIQLFRYAIKNDIVNNNYAEHIEIHEKSEKTGKVFEDGEIKALWDNVDHPVAQWILILIYTGLRIGELLSLTANNIYLDKQYMVGGSKTEAGKDRVIPIHDAILPLVKKQLGDSKYLMTKDKGKKMDYQKARELFKDYMVKSGWEHLPHDTRKTAVSLMHGADIPIETIRIIVGHSGKGVTENTYLYKTPEQLVEAINMIKIM